ncbi:tyrosinase tyrosinase: common central domain protein [Rhizoctonia solani 123E]|uniref:Tyrosinase tyrosinase: common central domain protein n=1 Tax=Rhizoctonia solani 123E TaxID=1423351 RepID=A0A074S9M8_9AGAM|nr:tyrosinase tyrosinase: common central domain protein [Rhizoctonia solani 123E]
MWAAALTLPWLYLSSLLLPAVPSEPNATEGGCFKLSVRREWRGLSSKQKTAYHNAVKCINSKANVIESGGRSKTTFDDFSYVHYELRHTATHIFKWHRWFLEMHVAELKICGYTDAMPYWDWTRDSGTAANFLSSEMFHPTKGFGNLAIIGTCLEDGPYAGMQISVPEPHCLKRGVNPMSIDPKQWTKSTILKIMENSDFINFWNQTARIPHDKVHDAIHGDLGEHYSPNDPLFYLHHAQVDRMWTQWQGRNKTRIQDYAGNTIQNSTANDARLNDMMPMLGLAESRTVESMMDTQANGLCYTVS